MRTLLASILALGIGGAALTATAPAQAADVGFSISLGDRHHYHGDHWRGYYWHEGQYWHHRHHERYCREWRRHDCRDWGWRWTFSDD